MRIRVAQRVEPILHGHLHADIVGCPRLMHVGPDDRSEVATCSSQERCRERLRDRESPHGIGVRLLLEGDREDTLVDP